MSPRLSKTKSYRFLFFLKTEKKYFRFAFQVIIRKISFQQMRFSQLSNENVIYLDFDLTEMLHGSIEENAEEPRGERLKPDGWNSFG